jgi:hypothetical protein
MNKSKIKYLIIVSDDGVVYGSFYPNDRKRAEQYLEKLHHQYKDNNIKLFSVTNLNKFLGSLKHKKKKHYGNTMGQHLEE